MKLFSEAFQLKVNSLAHFVVQSRVLTKYFFAIKYNQIIIYQQLTNQDTTLLTGRPDLSSLENLCHKRRCN